ncbi:hypothetical protein ZWY2020_054952 [Hordeum vulgare]|nr:hypothetical protein ZWY2020_054952 [Hordeum vulgare]
MWRSFLARSQPVLSHLRRPSDAALPPATPSSPPPRGAHPRAYASGAVEDDAANSLPSSRRHLYVILDEMRTGHGIYRLDVDGLDSGDAAAVTGMDTAGRAFQQTIPPPCRLPEPVLRLGNSSVGSEANFAAVGSKIVVTGKTHRRYGNVIITLVYDTKTARLDIEEPPPASFNLLPWYHWRDCQRAVAVGNKLYMFDHGCSPPHYLYQRQGLEFQGGHFTQDEDETMLDMRGQTMKWTWKDGPWFPDQQDLRYVHPVQSLAVHPDGRTIFVSCFGDPNNQSEAPFTFSIDTEQDTQHGGGSSLRGDWSMPFQGRAYYDGHLDAWVGIRNISERPYLCSCDVPNLTDDHGDPQPETLPAPEWRTCKEELSFLKGASGRALVHTGRGRFCLVEATPVVPLEEGGEPSQCNRCTMYRGNEHLLHVTMFCAKHGKDGELVIAPCRPGSSYLVPNYAKNADENPPIAFWM